MVLPSAFDEAHDRAEALERRTTLGIGGRPDYLFEPASAEEAGLLVRLCRRHGVGLRILGGGSNLLVDADRVAGAVVATRRLTGIEIASEGVRAGAGASFPALARRAAPLGIPVLSGCSGIPGTVGGAVVMNAGGRFGTVAEAIVAVEGIDADGLPFHQPVSERDFGYRSSPFADVLVTAAVFRREASLDRPAAEALFRQALDAKRGVQPLGARSAGCIFKNPNGPLSAGRLIDAAGLKGQRVGGASVSTRHANFIVNDGGATSDDMRALILQIRQSVEQAFGVELELEVRVWS